MKSLGTSLLPAGHCGGLPQFFPPCNEARCSYPFLLLAPNISSSSSSPAFYPRAPRSPPHSSLPKRQIAGLPPPLPRHCLSGWHNLPTLTSTPPTLPPLNKTAGAQRGQEKHLKEEEEEDAAENVPSPIGMRISNSPCVVRSVCHETAEKLF